MRALYNIRKLFTAVSPLLLFANIGMATTPSSSIIGKVFNNDGRSVSLYAVENGRAVKMGFQWPSEDGTFHFNFPLASESIFFVTEGGFVPEQFLHPLYVKPGNTVELKLFNGRLSSDFDSIQVVTANRETLILQRWADIMSPLNSIGRKLNCHEQYFSLYNQVRQQGLDLAEKINTNNAYFNYLFKTKVLVDLEYHKVAAFFYYSERMNWDYDTSYLYKEFYYSEANDRPVISAMALRTENSLSMLRFSAALNKFLTLPPADSFSPPSISEALDNFHNDTLKGAYVIDQMENINSEEEFENKINPFKSYLLTNDMKIAYEKKRAQLSPFKRGSMAYNFSLRDAGGHNISLHDFIGKIVVVDIWAMWCAPCLHEKPYFKKLEEEYKHNKNIVFIGVSVDGTERSQVWKQFLEQHSWNGIELISSPRESIMEYYKIKGIPRFMIFDEKGNIITVDAPRPSNPALKLLLDQLLTSKS